MAINACKTIEHPAFALKQSSLDRMLVQAKVLHEQGKLRKVTAPNSRIRSKAEDLRVQALKA